MLHTKIEAKKFGKEWGKVKAKARKFNKLAEKAMRKPESANWFTIWRQAYELRTMVEAMSLYSEFKHLQELAMHIASLEKFAGRQVDQK